MIILVSCSQLLLFLLRVFCQFELGQAPHGQRAAPQGIAGGRESSGLGRETAHAQP